MNINEVRSEISQEKGRILEEYKKDGYALPTLAERETKSEKLTMLQKKFQIVLKRTPKSER